jgi:hypothetical protein
MSFALDLQKFAQKTKAKADDAVGNIVVRVASELDKRSPVGDASYWSSPPPAGYIGGHFRANWQLGVGVIPQGERDGVDTNGTVALPAIIAEIPEEAAGKVYWIVNNAPYARRLEDGWSRQAPQGLVQLTAIMFQSIVDEAVGALP